MYGKGFLGVLVGVCLLLWVVGWVSAAPISGRPGEPRGICVIVLPTDAEPAERYAAECLARYMAEMMGGEPVPVMSETQRRPEGRALLVGRTQDNLKQHCPDQWPADTIYIGYGAGDIAIIGQGSQGTLFAAFEFLRDQGCRWYMPTAFGSVVPKRRQLDLPDAARRHTPSFSRRGWSPTAASGGVWRTVYYPWAVRNGLNAMLEGAVVDYAPEHGYGTQGRDGHTLYGLIPSGDHGRRADTFAAHPEWYPLVDGNRVWEYRDGRPAQACTSNPQVVEEVARQIMEYFRQHPRCRRFSLGHNDEPSYWCECADCRALDGPDSTWVKNDIYDAYGNRSKAGPGPMSTRYVKFINQVARLVGREFPDHYISFYAYGSTCGPPVGADWSLESNVIVQYSHGGEECYRHSLHDAACETNAELVEWMGQWASRGNPVIYYDYPPMGPNPNPPTGFTHSYKRYLVELKAMGASGVLGEDQGTYGGSGLFHYLKARLLWDIDSDVDQLVHEFCRDLYGGAGDTMVRFYQTLESQLQRFPDHLVWGRWVTKFDRDNLAVLDRLLAQAAEQAQSPAAGANVMMMQAALNSWVIAQLMEDPACQKDIDTFERYQELCRDTQAMITELDEPFPVVVTPQWAEKLQGSYRPPIEALSGRAVLTLPLGWRFRTDPQDQGIAQNWPGAADTTGPDWHDIRVDQSWTDQGFSYHGVAWYVTEFELTSAVAGQLWLLFKVLDGEAEVWIDGRSVGTLPGDPWDKPKALEVTSLVKPERNIRIVVRVFKENYAAGILQPVKIMAVAPRIGVDE